MFTPFMTRYDDVSCSSTSLSLMLLKINPWRVASFHFALATLLATVSLGSDAAELGSFGKGELVVDACLFNTNKDSVRMFWRAPDGSFLGTFNKIQDTLGQTNTRLFCASNAGIYGKDLHPIGLYVENGHVLRRLNVRNDGYGNFYLQPNGVFVVLEHGAAIWTTQYVSNAWNEVALSVRYATQSGPIMIQSGQINPAFNQGSANRLIRNAVCTRSATEAVLIKSRMPINFYDFAQVLRDDIGCRDALYLDGSISELYPFDSHGLAPNFGAMIGVVEPAR